ncbi:MAG: 1-deoxy-D-xylulose-5-phosphate reductoisomerase [Desulfobacteraceae bacterium 4484_190.1]|nr:MAG: 1-deoxy-D-xylulose-5-phosphate reductoisomerase [Desulfobacteraceae bacterium 4484_190.1]
MKRIVLLGSTGSIGVNALKVIQSNPEKYRVIALGAGKNIDLLLKQIEAFRPVSVALKDEKLASEMRRRLPKDLRPDILYGQEGFVQLSTLDKADTIISAMTGAAGLLPTFAAIKAGKNIALANKETMVMAGPLVMSEAHKQGVSVIPIDSEHSAILQSLVGHPGEDISRVILTASGGPFRSMPLKEMRSVTPDQALNHPNWKMGPKISIDSATMMNKGLEAIEAKCFFNLRMDQISILIHPQSIVHSMVEYMDGSFIAQLGVHDMIIPISYALSFPHHIQNGLPRLELDEIGILSFEKPDFTRFKCLNLALNAAKTGGSMQTVLNGANEIAVEFFLDGRIGFLDIPDLIEKTIDAHQPYPVDSIEQIIEADAWARNTTRSFLRNEYQQEPVY